MKNNINIIVGKNIRRLRLNLGLSQEAFAEVCHLHRTYIGSIERGERNITLTVLDKIATSLNSSPQELLNLEKNV